MALNNCKNVGESFVFLILMMAFVSLLSGCVFPSLSEDIPAEPEPVEPGLQKPDEPTKPTEPQEPTTPPEPTKPKEPEPQPAKPKDALLPAFPGAEGFGAYARGGRGGAVIYVTNLNDAGPGSLRAAIETKGPRIVIFNVSGTIELKSRIRITNPYLTIAGQTAPGDGITIKNHPSNSGTPISVQASDVVIRFLRLRPGPCDTKGCGGGLDAISVNSGSNIIIDHCSLSWSVDEVASIWGSPTNVTYQWNIISEGLHHSTHPKGGHGFGFLLGSGHVNATLHHNLFAHHVNRGGPYINLEKGNVDLVNNVLYNARKQFTEIPTKEGHSIKVNYVGNYQKPGPDSIENGIVHAIRIAPFTDNTVSLYLKGNIGHHRLSDDLPETNIARILQYTRVEYPNTLTKNLQAHLSKERHPMPQVTTTSAFVAYEEVLAKAGAILPKRDVIDERIVNDVRKGIGRIIDHPNDVGGWVKMKQGVAPVDSDGDGMPDWWELQHFGCATCGKSNEDSNNNGYTNIEDYLNWLVSRD